VTYRYDSSLAPALDWDTNPARETASFLLRCIEDAAALPAPHGFPEPRELTGADGAALLRIGGLQDAVATLKRMQTPFLDWAGKAERQSFDVPTLPLFVHERLSTARSSRRWRTIASGRTRTRCSICSPIRRCRCRSRWMRISTGTSG
jgi:adenine-specific DNA-methyltransferase